MPLPQFGHRKPSGHRSRARYARQDSSVAKAASNSVKFRGYSSTTPAHYPLGSPESSRYPSRVIPGVEHLKEGTSKADQQSKRSYHSRYPRSHGFEYSAADPECGKQDLRTKRTKSEVFLTQIAGATGLEPATSCVTRRRSNQLNYAPANSLKMTSRSLRSLAVSCTAFHVLRRDTASFST